MIYLDMDGVIADFFRAFAKKNNVNHWKEIKDYKSALDDLKGTGFFFTLPKFTPLTDQIYLLVTQTAEQNNMGMGYMFFTFSRRRTQFCVLET